MTNAGMQERVLGRVEPHLPGPGTALGNIEQLPSLVKKYRIKEVIFCENGLRVKEMIGISNWVDHLV